MQFSPLPDVHRHPVPAAPPGADALCPTVFHEVWWLDAAAPGAWAEVTERAGDRIVGRLPYLLRPARLGGASCEMPDFCHFLGPAIDAGSGAACNRTLRRDRILRALIARLPPHGAFSQRMHRGLSDVLVFAEAGFHSHAQFTFEIAPDHPDRLWSAMRDKTRNVIRRAQERHVLSETLSPEDFARFYVRQAAATGTACYYPEAGMARVTAAALDRGRGRILAALGPDGQIAAAIFCVWDATCCYYLLSMRQRGADKGATALLLWEAIRHAAARGLVFDFDGLLTRGNRVFFVGFGGTVRPRYHVTRRTTANRLVRLASSLPARLSQRLTAAPVGDSAED